MAVINTGLLLPGLRAEFFQRFAQVKTYYQDLATRLKSDKDSEKYRWLGSVPQMREWGTGRLAKGLRGEAYDVENLKYEATLEVDRDEIDDAQTDQIRVRVNELANRAATHKDKMLADLLINGESAGFNAYDGKTFFAADHVSGASGTQSNKLDFDISAKLPAEPNTPDVASVKTLRTALSEAVAQMMTFKDDVGEPMDIDPTGLVVAVHPNQMMNWRTVVGAGVLDGTTNVQPTDSPVRILAIGRLTDVSKFYLLKANGSIRPFIDQHRQDIEFNAIEKGSEEEFLRDKYLYGVRARYRMTYGQWLYAVRVDLV